MQSCRKMLVRFHCRYLLPNRLYVSYTLDLYLFYVDASCRGNILIFNVVVHSFLYKGDEIWFVLLCILIQIVTDVK